MPCEMREGSGEAGECCNLPGQYSIAGKAMWSLSVFHGDVGKVTLKPYRDAKR